MNEEMEEAQVFARCGVLLSSNERKERGQNEPRDSSWWASGYRNWNDFAFKVIPLKLFYYQTFFLKLGVLNIQVRNIKKMQ